jgi:aspartate dehydrogenase
VKETSVGLIGYGGIARDVVVAMRESGTGARIVAALCRPGRAAQAKAALGDITIVESLADLIALRPSIVAEVAGQPAVAEYADKVLRNGVDCLVISVGALADPKLLERLKTAAHDGGSRLLLPAGAIGGIDAIAAMGVGGLTSVKYRSRKPPAAWRG